ncbi:MAG: MBL fold metallo-hydrolase [Nocardioidaceae bacterium]
MLLTIVGCSGSFPGPESPASCYLLEAPHVGATFRLVLDLGSGSLGELQKYVDLQSLDAVVLSHLHADHCLDLCGFYVVRKFHPDGHLGQIPVYGPKGTADRMARAYDLSPDPGMWPEFDFRTFPPDSFELGPFVVTVAQVDHPVDAFAVKVADGERSFVYSGDTGPCAALEELAEDCDLLLAEASFMEGGDNPSNLHLTGKQAALAANRAGAGRLVLTHIPPWHDREAVLREAIPHFPGDTSLALPGATYVL